MSTSPSVFGLDQPSPLSPFVDNRLDSFSWHRGVIDQADDQSLSHRIYCCYSPSDRSTHLAVRIRIDDESDGEVFQPFPNVFGAMTGNNDNVVYISRTKIVYAAFDHGAIAEGKQRLEGAHAARASGGEQDCTDVIQVDLFDLSLAVQFWQRRKDNTKGAQRTWSAI